jgi:hypothetical protein
MPKGKKTCPKCGNICGCPQILCSCGHKFERKRKKTSKVKDKTSKVKRKTPKVKDKTFKDKQDFILRMLDGVTPSPYKFEMMIANEVFKFVDYDLDFLRKVKPPFKMIGSIRYFRTKKGKEYLSKKKLEFHYKPDKPEKMVEQDHKAGEDIEVKKKKNLRDFLDE